jgi:PBP superfamily domain
MTASGNEGVASRIKISEGSIGYVEFGFAKRLGLPMALLENKAGRFIAPDDTAGLQSLSEASATTPSELNRSIVDPSGVGAYPIVTFSWLLLYRRYDDPLKGEAVRDFVGWGLSNGQTVSQKLGYFRCPVRWRHLESKPSGVSDGSSGADAAATTVSAPTPGRVLDLEAIEATLRDLQSHFPEINKLLKSRRDTIDDGLIANMMTG